MESKTKAELYGEIVELRYEVELLKKQLHYATNGNLTNLPVVKSAVRGRAQVCCKRSRLAGKVTALP